MKKGAILFGVLTISILMLNFAIAATNSSDNSSPGTSQSSKVDDAYKCIEKQIDDKGCDKLSLREQIFSLWADGKCSSNVKSAKLNSKCWPVSKGAGSCDVKTTAQVLLALSANGDSDSSAESWLSSQNSTPTQLTWLLQIDSNSATKCKISYDGNQNIVQIADDKKVQSGAGSCLSKDSSGYWLRVNPNCYTKTFEISCDKDFITSLLYQKQGSDTIYVSETTHSQSAEGTTEEQVNSLCFANGGTCNYEGSLWAATALAYLDDDVASFIPYLVALAPDNDQYLPDSFLYYLTAQNEFKNNLLVKQISSEYWDYSGNKFYDTAVALYPLRYESPSEKTNAINWLLNVQGKDGCWNNGNLGDTAFLLATVWPKQTQSIGGGTTRVDCINSGYYCTTSLQCGNSNGNVLSSYSCSGTFSCCSVQPVTPSCSEQGGKICNSQESCIGGTTSQAPGLNIGETCCIQGSCQIVQQNTDTCIPNGGICRIGSCNSDEQVSTQSCSIQSDNCCIPSTDSGGGIAWWIWVLVVLIILVVLGIIFRDRLRFYLFRSRGSPSSRTFGRPGPGFPQTPSREIPSRFGPRQMIPSHPMPPRRPMPQRSSELDDVLKKLKQIGK